MRRFIRLAMAATSAVGLFLGSTRIGAQEPAKKAVRNELTQEEKQAIAKELARIQAMRETLRDSAAKMAEELDEKDSRVLWQMEQLLPFVRAEYQVVVHVCEPTDEQRRKLAETFPRAVHDSAKRWVERYQTPPLIVERDDPDAIVTACVADLIKPILTNEQTEHYQADIQARRTRHKETSARAVVAILDRQMHLSAEQRGEIAKVLAENWDDRWVPFYLYLDPGFRYFPAIPDQFIAPHLDETQQKIWQALDKSSGSGGPLVINLDNQPLEDALRKPDQPDPAPTTQPK